MPLLTFDIIEGRSESEIKTLLDAAHRAVVQAFKVPERDRYQIVHENKAHHMIIEDTGLGLTRSREVVVVRVYTSPRSEAQKQLFYATLQAELEEHCGLSGDELGNQQPQRGLEFCSRRGAVHHRRTLALAAMGLAHDGFPGAPGRRRPFSCIDEPIQRLFHQPLAPLIVSSKLPFRRRRFIDIIETDNTHR